MKRYHIGLFHFFYIKRLFLPIKISWLLLSLLVCSLLPFRPAIAGGNLIKLLQEQSLLDKMTPEERIGQLFLVSFNGTDATAGSAIELLIHKYHIGGVILSAENDNFTNETDILTSTQALIQQIQLDEWSASSTQSNMTDDLSGQTLNYVPLFIGISQEGDGTPYDQILSGLTGLPTLMTIGATWQPDFSAQAGLVMGRELEMLGFNLIFGPVLDVIETPYQGGQRDIGTRAFGGDPFWVSIMGQSYIQGLHLGSSDRLAVVSKHFPGYGSADRIPEDEVATVRRSLSDLVGFDLIPFISVTGEAPTNSERTDAIMVSHLRFQGFQESSPRATTKPISVDQSAMQLLLEVPAIQSWYNSGGLTISDDLGSRALRGFLDLNSQSFDARRVVLNALLSGIDLVYISDFSNIDQPDNFTATVETFNYLTQKYREDPAFAERVDEAVKKILALKYRIYGNFTPSRVFPIRSDIKIQPGSDEVVFEITRNSATLVNPDEADLDQVLPDPPKRTDRIVFITDTRPIRQCSKCQAETALAKDALQNTILKRYGPTAGRQVVNSNLSSYTLSDLEQLLANQETSEELQRKLALSHWIIFSMLDKSDDYPSYDTLSRFLARRPDLIQGKKIILFAFNAPYYLDATDISKITAFYCLYSKTPQAVDVAAYLLFDELSAPGALPVSVPGINYDLNASLFPDPQQTITLEFINKESPEVEPSESSTPAPPPKKLIGDIVDLQTSVIIDSNNRKVPDGTLVEFTLSVNGDAPLVRQVEYTKEGVARTSFMVTSPGSLEFRAQSEQAISNILRLDIPSSLEETPPPTNTPEPTDTQVPTPTHTATATPEVLPIEEKPNSPTLLDWVIACLVSGMLGWIGFRLIANTGQIRWAVRVGFTIFLGGIIAYTYLALHLPGTSFFTSKSISQGVILITILGGILGLFLSFIWKKSSASQQEKKSTPLPYQGEDKT
jgi:beta-N-acetylhexosaminidase